MKRLPKTRNSKTRPEELSEDIVLDAIPVDARDGLIDINEPDGSFGRYTWYVRFAPFSEDEAKIAADGITKSTGRRTTVASSGREVFVLVMDYPSRGMAQESRKLVKEGAGAGYTVKIKDLKFGDIKEKKLVKGKERYDDYYVCQVEILPGEYEIAAEDYYNDFFWQEHDFGETPTAKIDGGMATIVYSTNSYDEEEAEDELRREISNREMDISFDYGAGWVHVDLPTDKPLELDRVDVEGVEFYGGIEKLELNAPDLAAAVNDGHQSIYDRDEEEEENLDDENEEYDESIEDNEEDTAVGDGQWHVFDFGPDFDFYERYTVIAPDGYVFFIGSDGGVGSFEGERMSYSTSEEMCDVLATKDRKGNEVVPSELELSPDGISHDRIVSKGLTRIKDKYDYSDED